MTRKQRNQRAHQRREAMRRQAGAWGTNGRCAHCGHTHKTRQTAMDMNRCPNCGCRDFDF